VSLGYFEGERGQLVGVSLALLRPLGLIVASVKDRRRASWYCMLAMSAEMWWDASKLDLPLSLLAYVRHDGIEDRARHIRLFMILVFWLMTPTIWSNACVYISIPPHKQPRALITK